MAKITRKEIIDDNVFSALQKEVATLEASIVRLTKTFIDSKEAVKNIKLDKNLAKGIKQLDEAERKLIKDQKELQKQNKERVKIQKQLIQQTDEQVRAKLRFSKANKAQRDEIKDLIILEDRQAGTEERLLASTRRLERQRKALIKTDKNYERDLKRLNNRIDNNTKNLKKNVDQTRRGKLEVGQYAKGIKEAAESSGLFGSALFNLSRLQATLTALTKKNTVQKEISTASTFKQIIAEKSLTKAKRAGLIAQKALNTAFKATGLGALILLLGGLTATLTRTQKNVDRLSDLMASMGAIMDSFIDRFALVGDGVIKLFDAVVSKFTNFKLTIEIGLLELKKSIINIFSINIPSNKLFEGFTIGVQDADKKVSDLDKQINSLNKELEETATFADGIKDIKDAFVGFGDEIEKEIALAAIFNSQRRELNREQKIFNAQLAVETTLNKQLKSFVLNKLNADKERLATVIAINDAEIRLSNKQLELSERDVALAIDSVKLEGERLEFINKIRSGKISTVEAIAQAEKLTLSSAAGEETLFNIIEKIVKLEQDKQKLADSQATSAKRIGSITKEIAAKEAKGLLVKAQNELKLAKQIERSDEARLESLFRFEETTIKSYKTQLDANIITLEEFNSQRIKAEIQVQEEIERINSRQTKSEQQLLEFRASVRTTLAKEESEARIKDFQELESFNKSKFDSAIDAIEKQKTAEIEAVTLKNAILLENEKLAADDITKIKEQEAEEIRKINKQTLDKQLELQEKAEKQAKISAEDTFDFLIKLDKKRFDEKISAIDREIEASEMQQEVLARAAENGIADAKDNLVLAERQEADARARKAEELKKQKRDESALVYLKLIASHIDAGDKNPIAGATIDYFASQAFINSLPSFYVGSDRLGHTDKPVDDKGGFLQVNHPDEKIMTAKHNKEMDYAPNSKVVENYKLAEQFKTGELDRNYKTLNIQNNYQSNSEMIKEFVSMKNVVKDLPKNMPKYTPIYDPISKTFVEIIEQGNRRDRYITKVGQGGILGTD